MRTMKIIISLSLLILFIGSCFSGNVTAISATTSQSGTSLTVYNYDNPNIVIGDQAVSKIWSSVPKLAVPAFSGNTPNGYVQFLHDSNYVYALFAYDTNAMQWVGVEFNAVAGTPMKDGNVGWIFGTSSPGNTYYGGVTFAGEVTPIPNPQQGVSFERIVDSSTGLTYIEAMRPMNTNDPTGTDIVFTPTMTLNVRFASSKLHKTLNPNDLYQLKFTSSNLVIKTTQTTTTTSTTPLAVLKGEHLQEILIWGSVGLFFNLILINLLIIYHRRT